MAKQECEENIIMKVRVYSQWLEEVEVPVRTKQFTKAARLMGHADFASFAAWKAMNPIIAISTRAIMI